MQQQQTGRFFERSDEVRENEIDVSGVVNHAILLSYMGDTRHKHLRELGIDFQALLARGYMLVATKVEVRYSLPLFAGDQYIVTSRLVNFKSKMFVFEHQVLRKRDRKLVSSGRVHASCIHCETNQSGLPADVVQTFKEVCA